MLTDAQKTNVRRWLGYPTITSGAHDTVYSIVVFPGSSVTLTTKLEGLTSTEEVALLNTYLYTIETLETAILGAADNMDTDKAGPWVANRLEASQRTSLFKQWCRQMCGFLGFEPGPGLNSGGATFIRV